ncbi:hypothetical protein ACP275_03G110700 [Erythranthe tilingii]
MCINLRKKPLNPKALEWRPKPQPLKNHQPLLPHLMLSPRSPPPLAAPLPPQQAAMVTFMITPIPPHYPYHPNHQPAHFIAYNIVHSHHHVLYDKSFPAAAGECFSTAAEPICGDETVSICCENSTNSSDEKEMDIPTRNRNRRCKRIFPRVLRLPPRLRRDLTSDDVRLERKPSPKQEWRPRRNPANPSNKDSSCCGGATLLRQPPSPAPSSGDGFSRSSHTTVMMKNIPNHLRREFMLEFLDEYCKEYSLEYDFLYLPMDFRRKDNLGYAFVNLTSAAAAKKFKRILHNFKWESISKKGEVITSKKICEVTWAKIQGKEALIKRFENSIFSCDNLDFLPVVLDPPRNGWGGNRVPPVVLGTVHRARSISKIR